MHIYEARQYCDVVTVHFLTAAQNTSQQLRVANPKKTAEKRKFFYAERCLTLCMTFSRETLRATDQRCPNSVQLY